MQLRELSFVLCDNLEEQGGGEVRSRFKRKEIYVSLALIHIVVWRKPTQHCKAIILHLKKKEKGAVCFCIFLPHQILSCPRAEAELCFPLGNWFLSPSASWKGVTPEFSRCTKRPPGVQMLELLFLLHSPCHCGRRKPN